MYAKNNCKNIIPTLKQKTKKYKIIQKTINILELTKNEMKEKKLRKQLYIIYWLNKMKLNQCSVENFLEFFFRSNMWGNVNFENTQMKIFDSRKLTVWKLKWCEILCHGEWRQRSLQTSMQKQIITWWVFISSCFFCASQSLLCFLKVVSELQMEPIENPTIPFIW